MLFEPQKITSSRHKKNPVFSGGSRYNSGPKSDRVEEPCREKGAKLMKIEPGSLTGNILRDDILITTACSVRADKQILSVFSESEAYVYKTLSDMKRRKLILTGSGSDAQLALTVDAIRELEKIAPKLHRFYMQYSNNNHPGLTESHKSGYKRVSEITACMRQAGVLVGPEKASVADIYSGKEEKLTLENQGATFFMNKELRGPEGVKENRSTISRSSGVLFSAGLTALVYNCGNRSIKFGRVAEKTAKARLVSHMKSIYADIPPHEPMHSIVFCDNDNIALEIFKSVTNSASAKTNLFGDAVRSKKVIGTEILYIPVSAAGAKLLHWLSTYGPAHITASCFDKEEIYNASRLGLGDAIIKDLICYEFISCNLSKLEVARQKRKEGVKVGIICTQPQLDFVVEYIGPPAPLPVRVLSEQEIQRRLVERRG